MKSELTRTANELAKMNLTGAIKTEVINNRVMTDTEPKLVYLAQQDRKLSQRKKGLEVFGATRPTIEPAPQTRNPIPVPHPDTWYNRNYQIHVRPFARAKAAQELGKMWYVEADDINAKMKVLKVLYVPENTFKTSEYKSTHKCRLIVYMEAPDGKRYVTNIANQMHALIGNASKRRAEALVAHMPETVLVRNGNITVRDIRKWFKAAELPFRK